MAFPCRNPGKRRRGFPPCLYTLRVVPRHTCDARRIFAWPRRALRLHRRISHAIARKTVVARRCGSHTCSISDHGVLYGCCRLDSRISLPKRFRRIIRRYRQCRRLAERVVQHAYGRLHIHRHTSADFHFLNDHTKYSHTPGRRAERHRAPVEYNDAAIVRYSRGHMLPHLVAAGRRRRSALFP
ncbi:hypothetical protein IMSAGC008_02391 [Muribaculaceae bacterium]|nr:hypothetical protein IMSAGC008_02391 [Muribaculaceae bacterium]